MQIFVMPALKDVLTRELSPPLTLQHFRAIEPWLHTAVYQSIENVL